MHNRESAISADPAFVPAVAATSARGVVPASPWRVGAAYLRDLWLIAPGLSLAAGAVAIARDDPDLPRLVAWFLAAIGVVITWAAAAAVRNRYPDRPLWILLCALALAQVITPFGGSPDPWRFTLARAMPPPIEVLLVAAMLGFPTGRLTLRAERAVVAALTAAVLLLWLPVLLFSARIPLPGGFVPCGADCPRNVLLVADRPEWAHGFAIAFRVVGFSLLIAASLRLLQRLRLATPLMRRALMPVLLASIARVLYIAAFLATSVGILRLFWSHWAIPLVAANLTFYAIPLAIVWGMLRSRLYTARALERLVTGLRRRPRPSELRVVIAEALDDPELQIGYRDEANGLWVDAFGHRVTPPTPAMPDKAARVLQDAQGRPAAMLVHDRALLEEPLLLDAVISSMQGALFSHQAEMAMADRQAEAATAIELERRRIERDLHDGAQQRLLALRMKLGVGKRLLDHDPRRAATLMMEMDSDIEAAIAELRALAHGVVPPLLAECGLAIALAEAASSAPIPVSLDLADVGRVDPAVERAIYFSCVEALQNAAKHAGDRATARITLRRDADAIRFSVEDSGPGMAQGKTGGSGQGLRNIRERLLAVGGQLDAAPGPTSGWRVSGTAPAPSR